MPTAAYLVATGISPTTGPGREGKEKDTVVSHDPTCQHMVRAMKCGGGPTQPTYHHHPEVAGAGVYLPAAEVAFDHSVWGTVEEYGDARLERCRAFLPVPGVLQTVQRAEFWCAIVALQAYWPCHLGIDNLNVVRSIGCLLDADCLAKPLPLVKDGDLVGLVHDMIRTRGRDNVQHGRVRLVDQQGNVEADLAADLGRRHQSEILINARRKLLQARSYWYPIMTDLHRFMIAIGRVSVNPDGKGGTAPDPLVWDQGSRPTVRKLAIRVNVDLASLPGPPEFFE